MSKKRSHSKIDGDMSLQNVLQNDGESTQMRSIYAGAMTPASTKGKRRAGWQWPADYDEDDEEPDVKVKTEPGVATKIEPNKHGDKARSKTKTVAKKKQVAAKDNEASSDLNGKEDFAAATRRLMREPAFAGFFLAFDEELMKKAGIGRSETVEEIATIARLTGVTVDQVSITRLMARMNACWELLSR
ncbi:hypothetical protein TI39_contig482g00011 [Zymoseptoria brevis]|uniref:Uncharacterized protein n=1 Tax=Zymoseptoria brevis TaxID=1047168 RepID=A0A0F4GJU2_9PEZI|nr:hypothetical protein TI39_contig482g00011 [Zymoseptoria brevis]